MVPTYVQVNFAPVRLSRSNMVLIVILTVILIQYALSVMVVIHLALHEMA